MSLKAKIEAVLFLTAKPIRAQALARIVNADLQAVRQAVLELVHDYEERQGALEIADDQGYTFQVKDEYASLMDEFLPVEMSAALIRTLSAIAIKQPISQSEIIRIRGAGAYEHIRELVIKELIAKREEQGERSPTLSTTKKFQEYFRLTKEGKDLRTYLKRQVKKAEAADDAVANERQLVIPAMVAGSEAEIQLNNGIFLETADYSNGESTDGVNTAAFDGSDASADNSINDFANILSIGNDSGATEAETLFAAGRGDTRIDDLPAVHAEQPAAEADAAPEAATTLSKLAAAAINSKEPVSSPESDLDADHLSVEHGQALSSGSLMPPPPPVDVSSSSGSSDADQPLASGKGALQAFSASKGPAMAGGKKKGRSQMPSLDKLTDLVQKQKKLQMQLQLGIFDANVETEESLELKTPFPAPDSEKTV